MKKLIITSIIILVSAFGGYMIGRFYNTQKRVNPCCLDKSHIHIDKFPGRTVLGMPVVVQIEKCSVCGEEHAYRITQDSREEISVDFVKGLIGQ